MKERPTSMDRRGFLRLAGLGATGLAVIDLAACTQDGSGDGGGGPLRIGALYPISGSLALLGEESWRGVEIALELRNQKGGVAGRKLEAVRADIPDVNAASSEARRLVTQENLGLLVGAYSSSLSLAASEVAARSGKTYFELGAIADDITNRGYQSVWRTNPPAKTFTEAQLEFVRDWVAPALKKEPAALKIAIAHEDSAYGSSVARTLEEQAKPMGFGTIVKVPYSAKANDLSAIVLNLKSIAADVVIAVSYAQDAVLLGRQAKENGLRIPVFIGTGGGHSLASFAEGLGPAADGVFNVDFTQFEVQRSFAPGLEDFLAEYRKRYSSEPRSGHSLANFMGANVVFDILEQTKGSTDPKEIARVAKALDVPEGKTATGWGVRFDDKNQNTRAKPFVTQWSGGKLKTVWPKEAAVMEPVLKAPFQA